MNISKHHSNKRHHNWLVYNIGDRFLKRGIPFYKGALYDFGCGEATFKDFFLQYADRYIGVDWSDSFHDIQADIVADLNSTVPIDSGSADTIVSFAVLEHLCEPQNMLNEGFRILKSGGTLIMEVPWQWWIHEEPHDYFRYSPYALNYMLKKAGFCDVTVTAQSGFFTMLIIKINYFTRRFVRGPFIIKILIQALFIPFWYLGQILAPLLDKLDHDWDVFTLGYFVVAKKP